MRRNDQFGETHTRTEGGFISGTQKCSFKEGRREDDN